MRKYDYIIALLLTILWASLSYQILDTGINYLRQYPTFAHTGWAIVCSLFVLNMYFIYALEHSCMEKYLRLRNMVYLALICTLTSASGFTIVESLVRVKHAEFTAEQQKQAASSSEQYKGVLQNLAATKSRHEEEIAGVEVDLQALPALKIKALAGCHRVKGRVDPVCSAAVFGKIEQERSRLVSLKTSTLGELTKVEDKITEISTNLVNVGAVGTTNMGKITLSYFEYFLAFLPDLLTPPLFWLIVGLLSGNIMIFKKMHSRSTPNVQLMLDISDDVQSVSETKKAAIPKLKLHEKRELLLQDLKDGTVETEASGKLSASKLASIYKLDRRTVSALIAKSFSSGNIRLRRELQGTVLVWFLVGNLYTAEKAGNTHLRVVK